MFINEIDYDNYFDENLADNLCILRRNIEIQIENMVSVIRSGVMNKKQIKKLSRSLEAHRFLSNRTRIIKIDYKNIFMLILEFEDLAQRFDAELSKIERSLPVMTDLEEFVDMCGEEYYGLTNLLYV